LSGKLPPPPVTVNEVPLEVVLVITLPFERHWYVRLVPFAAIFIVLEVPLHTVRDVTGCVVIVGAARRDNAFDAEDSAVLVPQEPEDVTTHLNLEPLAG
jgi:hypothetical protein